MSGNTSSRSGGRKNDESTGMDIFRRRQKPIMWAVAILVILSFALFWGVDKFPGMAGPDIVVAQIFGKEWRASERARFVRRMEAAAGSSIHFAFSADPVPQGQQRMMGYEPRRLKPEFWAENWNFIRTLHQKALQAGVTVSDAEVGTWLRRENSRLFRYFGEELTEEEFRLRLRNLAREMGTTEAEIVAGARDWLVLRRYLELNGAAKLETAATAYTAYATNEMQYVFRRARFNERADNLAAARSEWDALNPDEQKTEAERIVRANRSNPDFLEASRWRISYLQLPDAAAPEPEAPSEEKLAELHAAADAEIAAKPLDEVREQIVEKYRRDERRAWATRTIHETVFPVVLRLAPPGDDGRWPSPENIAAAPELAGFGLVVGDTGETLLSREEILALPAIGADNLLGSMFLDADTEARLRSGAASSSTLARLRRGYTDTRFFDGGAYNLPEGMDLYLPLEGPDGPMIVRVTDHRAAAPLPLFAGDGARNDALWEKVGERWMDEKIDEKNRQAAVDAVRELRANPDAAFPEGGEVETLTFHEIARRPELVELAWGAVTEPLPVRGGEGYEILRLEEKRQPSAGDFAKLPADQQRQFSQAGYTAHPPMVVYNVDYRSWDLLPGSSLWQFLSEAIRTGIILKTEPASGGVEGEGEYDTTS